MSDPTGSQLGQYQLTQLIHRGAMSAIYKTYQPSLDRFVAIKVLFSDGDPQFAMRFKRSARSQTTAAPVSARSRASQSGQAIGTTST